MGREFQARLLAETTLDQRRVLARGNQTSFVIDNLRHNHTWVHRALLADKRRTQAAFYVDAAAAYRAAVANVTEAYEHAAWRYLHALRDDVVYGYGSPFTSTHFGRAAANLMDTVALKLKHGDRVPEELRPENHSPLGA